MLDMYMTIFVNAIKHPIYKGFVHIYEQSRVFNKTSQYSESRVLESFQDILRTIIPTWDQKTVSQETNRLRTTSMLHKTLDELYYRIRSLIVMIAMGGSVMDDGDEIRRSVVDSSFETYIHKVYIMAAKDFFIAPMVFYHDAPVEHMFDNYQRILTCIDSSIRGVLYVGLPLSDMLNSAQYYMSNKYADDQAGQIKRTFVDVFSRLPVFQKPERSESAVTAATATSGATAATAATAVTAATAASTSRQHNQKTLELQYNPKSTSTRRTESDKNNSDDDSMNHLTNSIHPNSIAGLVQQGKGRQSAVSSQAASSQAATKHGSVRSTNKSIKDSKKDSRHHGASNQSHPKQRSKQSQSRSKQSRSKQSQSPTVTTYSAEYSTSDSAESDSAESDASNHTDTIVDLFKRQPMSANQTNDDDVSSVSHVTFVAKK